MPALFGGGLVLAVAAGSVWAWTEGHLAAIGLEAPNANASDSDGPELGDDEVRVLLATQSIPSYTKLRREHLLVPGELKFSTTILPRKNAEAGGLITNMGDIIGRVLAAPKSLGYAFREEDFLPGGTRPGLVGGIPAGRRGLRVEASKLQGIAGLNPGDHFDLVGAFPVSDEISNTNPILESLVGANAQSEIARGNFSQQARVDVLVHDGLIVEPLTIRQVPITSSTLTQGLKVQTKPVEELFIALAPEEVGPLLEAFSLEVDLTVLPRSGRPGDDPTIRTPDHEPDLPSWMQDEAENSGMQMVEAIVGSERALVPVMNR